MPTRSTSNPCTFSMLCFRVWMGSGSSSTRVSYQQHTSETVFRKTFGFQSYHCVSILSIKYLMIKSITCLCSLHTHSSPFWRGMFFHNMIRAGSSQWDWPGRQGQAYQHPTQRFQKQQQPTTHTLRNSKRVFENWRPIVMKRLPISGTQFMIHSTICLFATASREWLSAFSS